MKHFFSLFLASYLRFLPVIRLSFFPAQPRPGLRQTRQVPLLSPLPAPPATFRRASCGGGAELPGLPEAAL